MKAGNTCAVEQRRLLFQNRTDCKRWRPKRHGNSAGLRGWLHRRIREDWGFPDPPEMTMAQRFKSRYRGKRCPNLEDQTGLWKLLRPVEIGVQLTEGIMMDREATADASYCRCRVLVPACPVGGFPPPPVPLT